MAFARFCFCKNNKRTIIIESIAAQAAYQLRYKNTEYYSWVSSGPKCFQVLRLSPSLL